MKSTPALRIAPALAAAIFIYGLNSAQAGNTWDGGGSDDNWGTTANWSDNTAPGYGTLVFSGTTRVNNTNNSVTAMNQVNWNGTAAWTMAGSSTLSLFDFGGSTPAKLESYGSGGVTINAPITFAATSGPNNGEINAVSSDMTFAGNTVTVNGSVLSGIKFWGTNTVIFNNTVSASGKWFGMTTGSGAKVTIGGAVTSGDFYVMNGGTLNLASGGSLTTSAIRIGGDFGNTGNLDATKGGTFNLTSTTGGQNFSSTINAVLTNTSGALVVNSANTSGTNILSGSIFLDSNLRFTNAVGGTLSLAGTTDVKAQQVIFGPSGTITVGPLTSSLGAGGTLLLNGPGTLNLTNTANNYTGTSTASLNANGTQISNGGTLNIWGAGSLGLAPAGAYNNIQFTGSGTLRDAASNISLSATRSISIASGATATLDSSTNTFTIYGVINGSGALTKSGSGTLVLTNVNTYSGTTTVSEGTLLVLGSTAAGSAVSVASGATLGGTGTINGAITINSGGTLAPGNNGIGTLTNATGPTLGGIVFMEINRSVLPNADKLVRTGGTLTNAGTLTVTNIGAAAQNGDVFDLFDASSFSGAFATLNLPPGGAAHWKTNNLVVDGTISFTNINPVAAALTLGVSSGGSNSVLVVGGKHPPTDADGDSVSITAVTQGANGTVNFTGTSLTYTSTNTATDDSFTYTVSDGLGGTDTKTVTVLIASAQGFNRLSPVGTITNGVFTLTYLGIPTNTYAIEHATNLTPPIVWTPLLTNQAATNGYLIFNVTNTGDVNFFRTQHVP